MAGTSSVNPGRLLLHAWLAGLGLLLGCFFSEGPAARRTAAAPQAAGLAAVLLSRHPEWAPMQILDALRSAAENLGPPGHYHETGYGSLRLPK